MHCTWKSTLLSINKKEEKAAKSDCEEAGLTIVNAVRKNAFKELKQAFIALIYALPHEEESLSFGC